MKDEWLCMECGKKTVRGEEYDISYGLVIPGGHKNGVCPLCRQLKTLYAHRPHPAMNDFPEEQNGKHPWERMIR